MPVTSTRTLYLLQYSPGIWHGVTDAVFSTEEMI